MRAHWIEPTGFECQLPSLACTCPPICPPMLTSGCAWPHGRPAAPQLRARRLLGGGGGLGHLAQRGGHNAAHSRLQGTGWSEKRRMRRARGCTVSGRVQHLCASRWPSHACAPTSAGRSSCSAAAMEAAMSLRPASKGKARGELVQHARKECRISQADTNDLRCLQAGSWAASSPKFSRTDKHIRLLRPVGRRVAAAVLDGLRTRREVGQHAVSGYACNSARINQQADLSSRQSIPPPLDRTGRAHHCFLVKSGLGSIKLCSSQFYQLPVSPGAAEVRHPRAGSPGRPASSAGAPAKWSRPVRSYVE